MSRGIASELRKAGVEPAEVEEIVETPGLGMRGRIGGREVALVRSEDAGEGLAVDFVDGAARIQIHFADPRRPDLPEALAALAGLGLKARILSGDRTTVVQAVARDLGIPGRGDAHPDDKLAELKQLADAGERVLMVGDGLNDGPALAGAHVSIAPGGASDVSQQASDAVFVGDNLMPVALAVRVARRTMAIVRQNFTLAVTYNVLAVPLAIFGYVTPLIAAIAMSASSLIVVGNSLRLATAAGKASTK